MDAFDYEDQTSSPSNVSAMIWNVLTAIALLVVLCVVMVS
jgi:hypothetical protein